LLEFTATLAREAARHGAARMPGADLRQLIRALRRIFFVAVLAAGTCSI
jgi:hypothetical protein